MDNRFYHVLNHSLCSFFPWGDIFGNKPKRVCFRGWCIFLVPTCPNMSAPNCCTHHCAMLGSGIPLIYIYIVPIQNHWIVGNTKDYAKYVDIHAAISKCCELVWQGISVKDAVPVHQEKSEQSYKNGFIHTRELSWLTCWPAFASSNFTYL